MNAETARRMTVEALQVKKIDMLDFVYSAIKKAAELGKFSADIEMTLDADTMLILTSQGYRCITDAKVTTIKWNTPYVDIIKR